MAAIQLNFTLRTSSNCKTVHLLGSWDGYQGQLPLSKDSKKSGGWVGTFKFQGATLKQGQRYWYYYIIDGYHVSHDPAKDHTTEPTTGRKLNIIDIPAAKKSSTTSSADRKARRVSTASVAKGRGMSPERIVAPKPQRPHQTRQVINTQYDKTTLEELNRRFAKQSIEESSEEDDDSEYDSEDSGSDVPSLTSRSTNSSSPSSVSSGSSCCTCERFGITRAGDRVKLDCGGARCGYSDDSSDCSSEDEYVYEEKSTRRQGVVIRS
ncbi:hypothetical protein IAQ61_000861 [Plenodomus lingam]|uniref:GTP-binding protein EsdC n=1 Tax=Leptosphaeria maculans (strain JN3 / isolate v23.1.3 / race Av1-4-5-6-7-8) TaxID=985895 RepID=E5A282_LEPMJ|nr:hypothetical protein LEMA_P093680.1 [Plenodomus lingam JN3]KAH9880568.1 hypothetical protein IAQ61_000861 [Plenodomus lingam]CBX97959.1 hypothetical protein LEMA_P093680.1 [Plenodomus lingam JN3]